MALDPKKLIEGFTANHDWLIILFYKSGAIGPDQHLRLHTMNWLLAEKKLFDEKLHELDLAGDEALRDERHNEVVEMLKGINIADIGWKAIDLKTSAEILKEAGR
jgi:hypothetical protein